MEGFTKQFCRLCLTDLSENKFEIIETTIRDILDVLVVKLKLGNGDNGVMCAACSTKLFSAFKFKGMCLNTDNTLIRYIDDEDDTQLDMREIYKKEKGGKQTVSMSSDQNVCRLCMQLVGDFMPLTELEIDMIKKFIPDMNFCVIKGPIICKQCSQSLVRHHGFLRSCLEAVEKIEVVCQSEVEGPQLDSCIKTELESQETVQDEGLIKTERIEVKIEEIKHESTSTWPVEEVVQTRERKYNFSDTDKRENRGTIQCRVEASLKNNDKCGYKAKNLTNIVTCGPIHKDSCKVQKNKFKECDCESGRARSTPEQHQLVHTDPSKVRMYKCDKCSYGTSFKFNLKSHELKHKASSQVRMYNCEQCTFQTKYKNSIKYHQLVHKDPAELPMYKCDKCSYECKFKGNLKSHKLLHKDLSEAKMYKCNECEYINRYPKNLKRHQLVHKDLSNVQMYKCDKCSHKTRIKSRLKMHMLIHMAPSEVSMYKCDKCEYVSKYAKSLKRHQLIHKDSSEVEMYKCDGCNYVTTLKRYLRAHQFKHKASSQVRMYKCEECTFETKLKRSLERHWKLHGDLSATS